MSFALPGGYAHVLSTAGATVYLRSTIPARAHRTFVPLDWIHAVTAAHSGSRPAPVT